MLDLAAEGSIVRGDVFSGDTNNETQPDIQGLLPTRVSLRTVTSGSSTVRHFINSFQFRLLTLKQDHSYFPVRVRLSASLPPILLLADPPPSENDFTFPREARRRAEDILISNRSTYFFQIFSGVSHGFAVRGDPNVPHARECFYHAIGFS